MGEQCKLCINHLRNSTLRHLLCCSIFIAHQKTRRDLKGGSKASAASTRSVSHLFFAIHVGSYREQGRVLTGMWKGRHHGNGRAALGFGSGPSTFSPLRSRSHFFFHMSCHQAWKQAAEWAKASRRLLTTLNLTWKFSIWHQCSRTRLLVDNALPYISRSNWRYLSSLCLGGIGHISLDPIDVIWVDYV